ncbi:MAG: CHAT domain-containing protein [Saprospiraceae bacterium]|nr:CHAT domain-containing protein [Saprospiraceae bacterium]
MKCKIEFFSLFILFLTCSMGHSQDTTVYFTNNDKQKIKSIIDTAKILYDSPGQIQAAHEMVDLGLSRLIDKNYPDILIYALYIKGRILEFKKEHKEALVILDSARQIAKINSLDTGNTYGRILFHLGLNYLERNEYILAQQPLQESLDHFIKNKNKNNILLVVSKLIDYYFQTNQLMLAENTILSTEKQIDSSYSILFLNYYYSEIARFYSNNKIETKANYYRNKIQFSSDDDRCIHLTNKLQRTLSLENFKIEPTQIDECLKCNYLYFSGNKNTLINGLLIITEVCLSPAIKKYQLADSILNSIDALLKIGNSDIKEFIKTDQYHYIVEYYFLRGWMAQNSNDSIEMGSIINRIDSLTNGFTEFYSLSKDKIELLLIMGSKYYYSKSDIRLNNLLSQYRSSKRTELIKALNYFTESELNQSLQNELYSNFDYFYSFYNPKILNEEYSNFLYELALYSKGLLYRSSKELNKIINQSGDSTIQDLAKKFNQINHRLDTLEYNDDHILLYKERDILERKLIAKMRSQSAQDSFRVEWIKHKLKSNEIAVEFVKYSSEYGNSNSPKYLALVLDSFNNYPKVIPLFSENQFFKSNKSIVENTYSPQESFSDTRGYGIRPKKSSLLKEYQLIWEPILKLYPKTTKIYFSTIGVLNNINLSTILVSDNTFIFEKYNTIQLSSTYNLVDNSTPSNFRIQNALLVGGLEFGKVKSTSPIKNEFSWKPLIGTLDEIKILNRQFDYKYISSTSLTGVNGSKSVLISELLRNYDLIHIASHGYYQPDIQKKNEATYYKINPLSKSKIVLSLANEYINSHSKQERESGYLNALEISHLDLSNTKLIVLSACETAVGDNFSRYESSYSLQRGFKIAGVKNIISTLWPVDDRATISFMSSFYKNLTNNNFSVNEAFTATQIQMRKLYPNDSNWKAFLLID